MERNFFHGETFLRRAETITPNEAEEWTAETRRPATVPRADVHGVAQGTRIKTLRGEVLVETLRPGDRVMTRDNGYQAIRWIGNMLCDVNAARGWSAVRLRKGALGRGMPDRALKVAAGQRLLLGGSGLRQHLDVPEGLVCAMDLTCLSGVAPLRGPPQPYVQILFDQHDLFLTEGTWSDSFLPTSAAMTRLSSTARADLVQRMPDPCTAPARRLLTSAEVRTVLRARTAQKLA